MARARKAFPEHHLSRRERQIMQAVHRAGQATVAQIAETIDDAPTNDAIRRLCHILQEKGHLRSRLDGKRRIYTTTVSSKQARRSALRSMLDTFFDGSPGMLAATLLDSHAEQLDPEDVERLNGLIEAAEAGDDDEGTGGS